MQVTWHGGCPVAAWTSSAASTTRCGWGGCSDALCHPCPRCSWDRSAFQREQAPSRVCCLQWPAWAAQVKLRGFRIELGEVEAAMADVPGVALAAALVLKDASGSQQLVGYVAPETVDPAAVLDSLKARLPAHFVPALVMPLARMPLTVNDKIDYKALAGREEYAPDWSAAAGADEYVAPRSDLERAVQGVWQEVLGLEQVSVESDFFRVGGNSIMANKVTSRLRAAMGVPLAGDVLFRHATIAALAAQLAAAGAGQGAGAGGQQQLVPAAGYDATALAAGVPVSSQQEQLLRGELDALTYVEEVVKARLRGPLDADALVGAWEALVARHAVLRTRFWDDGDRLMQVGLLTGRGQGASLVQDDTHAAAWCISQAHEDASAADAGLQTGFLGQAMAAGAWLLGMQRAAMPQLAVAGCFHGHGANCYSAWPAALSINTAWSFNAFSASAFVAWGRYVNGLYPSAGGGAWFGQLPHAHGGPEQQGAQRRRRLCAGRLAGARERHAF